MCKGTIAELAEEYISLQEQLQKIEQRKQEVRSQLISLLGEDFDGVVEGYKISIKKVQRQLLDTKKAYKILDIDIIQELSKTSESTQLRVKPAEDTP